MVRSLADLLSFVVRRGGAAAEHRAYAPRETCLVCGAILIDSPLYTELRVCPVCRFHYAMSARERIASIVDHGSFRETNRSIVSLDPLSFSSRVSYKRRIFSDQRRTGLTEAVVTGTCSIGDSPAVLVALDFGFMGGTMGTVVGEKVALAFEHAIKRKLPVVAVVTSGGSRVQEGLLSLLQMAKTTVAVNRFSEKGLPFISVLANPSTGQVFASFANLADVTIAEPGAIVAFDPAGVAHEQRSGTGGAHTSEAQLANGMIDGVVARDRLRVMLSVLLELMGPEFRLSYRKRRSRSVVALPRQRAWQSINLARHTSRPTTMDYIGRIVLNFVELRGDRSHGDDPSIVCGIGHLGAQTVVLIGQERGRGESRDRNDGMTLPEGFRKAHRAMRLAEKFEIPVITLIDTPRPHPGLDSESRGIGNAIAIAMSRLASLQVPTIAAVIGEGGSEGALALAVTDRVLMMENAIYTVMPPEDAAGLIYQDQTRVREVAESLRITAADCLELGIVDEVIHEPVGAAHSSPDEAARQLRRGLLRHMAEVGAWSNFRRSRRRYRKFRKVGEYSSQFRVAVGREIDALQGALPSVGKRAPSPTDLARRRVELEEAASLEIIGHGDHQADDGEAPDSRSRPAEG